MSIGHLNAKPPYCLRFEAGNSVCSKPTNVTCCLLTSFASGKWTSIVTVLLV